MVAEILIVDDDPLIRTALSDELPDHDLAVHVAANEEQAFKALDAYPDIALALVDYALPRPIGIGLCRRIASDYPGVAVALYTEHEALAGVRVGADDIPILSKAMRLEQLVSAIEALLDGRTPNPGADGYASRVELLWQRELRRETVSAVGRAIRNQYERTLREPLPPGLSTAIYRLREPGG